MISVADSESLGAKAPTIFPTTGKGIGVRAYNTHTLDAKMKETQVPQRC
jgi:hypothetical protein